MKRTLSLLVISFLISLKWLNATPFTIPTMQGWKDGKGTYEINEETQVCFADNELSTLANWFAEALKEQTGKTLEVNNSKGNRRAIVLKLAKNKKLGTEGYHLTVGRGITIESQTTQGLLWGCQTVLQLMDKGTVPCGEVTDVPQFKIRGFMIDCGRKYIPMSYLRTLVRTMSYYKMNTLQVHLNDNGFKQFFGNDWNATPSAFRLESDFFPGLTARDGSYTKKEFIEFQKYAKQLGVEIIPEIDVPAHSLAFTQYRPELGSKEYGFDHLDLFSDKTYQFLDSLFTEYLAGENPVFVGKRVHIGTDEYSNAKPEVVEKFRYFTDRYIRYVEGFGKQACVWGALTHAKGDTKVKSENVLMNCWYNGYADPKEMKKQGYQLVSINDGAVYIVPEAGYYSDYLNTEKLYNNWSPLVIGDQTFDDGDPCIHGGMFALWNDHVGNGVSVESLHRRIYPAIQTLSTKMWNGKNVEMNYPTFNAQRMNIRGEGFKELGEVGLMEWADFAPGAKSNEIAIGGNYVVEFDIVGAEEKKGTVLTSSDYFTFYLSNPVNGMFGYTYDDYFQSFNYRVLPGERVHIRIVGTPKKTTLYANNRIVDEKRTEMIQYNGKDKMAKVGELFFPLAKAGDFKSKVSGFKAYNVK